MIIVKQNYNSFKYWENIIRENSTIRGHMFMQNPPDPKSLYIHTLIFSKKNGINNNYAYFPDSKILLGYIQYSFLQEAFYKWIYGKNKVINQIPCEPVDTIIENGLTKGLIDEKTALVMSNYYTRIKKLWDLPNERIVPELIQFAREFNKSWFGNDEEFLYIKIFKNPIELGEFVKESAMITNSKKDFESKIGVTIDEWKDICENVFSNSTAEKKFRKIIQKNLSEVI
ncbi:hypothetical protein NNC19_08125 [Clostridium sp. SHJSY1]|uniref:hypothetical protein n=1 Tax=Clostridium sp. SHJSY1 TaxID=2942483 RepID=UPI0028743993|nr:hypothetical protein [Clostridium sp. SHJSY1]MDS0525641.1 hypothetical protein [Clostridium sp. SHJSY1]